MRFFLFAVTLFSYATLFGQEDKVYDVVNDPARLMVCEQQIMSRQDKQKCSEQRLIRYVTQNITYPEAAISDSIEGTVVVRFVVQKNGLIGEAKVLRDIGGGCGDVALAVIDSIRADSILWKPGILDSMFVDSYVTLPVRFRIPKIFDYELIDGDTIYTTLDKQPAYEGGEMAFNMYVQQKLGYPRIGIDSCLIGDFGAELKIRRNGKAEILDLIDYNGLGIDFEFQAIRMINAMPPSWLPGERKGKKVPSLYSARVLFQPPNTECASAISNYDRAVDLSLEGDELFGSGDLDGAIEQYSAAIDLVPGNAEFIYKRAYTYFELKNYEKGCPDAYRAKETLNYTALDPLLPILCRDAVEKE